MNSTNSSFLDLVPAWDWWRDASLLGWRATGTERERMAFALASAALLLVAIVVAVCLWVRVHRALRNSAACCAERPPSGTEPTCADLDNGFDEEVQDRPAPSGCCSTVREECDGDDEREEEEEEEEGEEEPAPAASGARKGRAAQKRTKEYLRGDAAPAPLEALARALAKAR